MASKLAKSVFKYLKERPEEKLTARQIAERILASSPKEYEAKKQSSKYISTNAELLQQLGAEISSQRLRMQKQYPELKTIEGRPRKYYYTNKSDSAEIAAAEETGITPPIDAVATKITEHALYPLLSLYLSEEFGVHSKRIDEKCSSNKRGPNGNRWLYPDVVGMEDLGAEWLSEVRDCVKHYSDKRTKLWSFEVKLLINRSNVRECFFQAVSNSSWANFGYLVAAEIEGQDTLKELQMLCAAHGIGLIKLDTNNQADSQVLIPAREKAQIDWNAANRLAMENKNFLEYLRLVKQLYQTDEAKLASCWDVPKVTN